MSMRTLLILILLAGVPGAAASTLVLEKAGDIRDIEQLDTEVDRLVSKVRQCAAAGLAPVSQCFCYYPAKLASTRVAYYKVLIKHPHWEDRAIRWQYNTSSAELHLGGLKKRIQACNGGVSNV
jgi:hypothetical protein